MIFLLFQRQQNAKQNSMQANNTDLRNRIQYHPNIFQHRIYRKPSNLV